MTAVVTLLLAFAGYSIHSIAQAGQKIGLTLTTHNKIKGSAVWILSTLSMPAAVFLILYAVSIGSASVVGAMSGSGLASMAVFYHLYMHERISKREIIGIFTIVAAGVLIGAFRINPSTEEVSLSALYIYLPTVCGIYLLLWFSFRKRTRIVGIVIAGFAGALGGFVPLFQKVSTSPRGLSQGLLNFRFQNQTGLTTLLQKGASLLSNPWAVGWIVISLVSMAVMQFAYRRGKAIQLIPAFAANTIAIPVLGGVLVFGERLHPLQWIGVILILSGVLLLTLKISYEVSPIRRDP